MATKTATARKAKKSIEQMSIAELQQELDERTRQALINAIQEAPERASQMVTEGINEILSQAVGVKYEYGRWSVEHCNSRKTAIANAIGARALESVEKALPNWAESFMPQGKIPADWIAPLKAEFKEQYRYKLRSALDQYLNTAVNAQAQRLVKEVEEGMKNPSTPSPVANNDSEPEVEIPC